MISKDYICKIPLSIKIFVIEKRYIKSFQLKSKDFLIPM